MSRKSNRRKQREKFLEIARKTLSRYNRLPVSAYFQTHLNGLQFAFSIIIHGLGYTSTSLCFLENGILPPSESCFYQHINHIIDQIRILSRESVDAERNLMMINTILGFDGSWDHRRKGKCCIVVAIDQHHKKIIDFEIVQKSTKDHHANYTGSPQGMETFCVSKIAQRLRTDDRIIGYVHDRDSSVTAFMSQNWPIKEYIDRNHAVKCLSTQFNKLEKICGKQDALFAHLYSFMQYLISFPCPSSQKVQYWKNASKHYCGDHSMCMKHKPSSFTWELKGNDEAVRALKDFLKNTAFILSQCQMPYSTQLNECYNSMKSHFLDKEIAWRRTAFARLCCAILDFN